jgi:hypothetical protein
MTLTKAHNRMIEGSMLNVKDFGAKGDSTTDDTAAIQAAINAAQAQRKALYFPSANVAAVYKITAPLNITAPISLLGDSMFASTIYGVGMSGGEYILNCDLPVATNYYFRFENLTIRSDNQNPHGMLMKNISYVTMKNMQFFTLQRAIEIASGTGGGCFSNEFQDVIGYDITQYTIYFRPGFTGGGHFTYTHCTFAGDTGVFIPPTVLTDGQNFISCNFEQCVTNSFYIGGTCRGLSFVGCRTEGCNGNDFQINPPSGESIEGLTITGCSFTTDSGASVPITLGGAGGTVRGFSITGNQVEYAGIGTTFVNLNGDGESGLIAGNYFAQSNTTPINSPRAGVVVFGNENGSGKCDEYWGLYDWKVANGTWTPIDASGAGLTFTSAQGNYQTVGNMVTYWGTVQYPSTANTTNSLIGGLPETILSSSVSALRPGAISKTNATLTTVAPVVSSTTIQLEKAYNTRATNADLSAKFIQFFGSYPIA